jgi:hypothetical protein
LDFRDPCFNIGKFDLGLVTERNPRHDGLFGNEYRHNNRNSYPKHRYSLDNLSRKREGKQTMPPIVEEINAALDSPKQKD